MSDKEAPAWCKRSLYANGLVLILAIPTEEALSCLLLSK